MGVAVIVRVEDLANTCCGDGGIKNEGDCMT